MKKLLQIIGIAFRNFITIFFWCVPIQKKIYVTSFFGKGYGDNSKAIVEELLNRKVNGLKIVWAVKKGTDKTSFPDDVIVCRNTSIASIFHQATAKIWIDNCRKMPIIKRKKQLYIQTWHGGGGQKKCELDAIEKLGKAYQIIAKLDSKNIDLMISESRFMTNLYHKSFWYNGPVYECGYPRYDILYQDNKTVKDRVYDYYSIDKNKELVLYAPTFRADCSFEAYNINFDRLLSALKRKFNKEYVVLVHLHPNVANRSGLIEYNGETIINSTFYPDTQELLIASAVLIGDYSSINYDFSLGRKPVFRYVSDLEAYKNDRDFYFSFEDYPYPYAENNVDLEKLIDSFDNEQYLKTLDAFFDKLGAVFNSDASKKVSNLIIEYCESKNKKLFIEDSSSLFIY